MGISDDVVVVLLQVISNNLHNWALEVEWRWELALGASSSSSFILSGGSNDALLPFPLLFYYLEPDLMEAET